MNETYACWLYNTGLGRGRILRMRNAYMELYGKDPQGFAEAIAIMPEEELKDFCREVFAGTQESIPDASDLHRTSTAAPKLMKSVGKGNISPEKAVRTILCGREDIGRALQTAERSGLRFYSVDDPLFPERLRGIPDAPYAVYVRGELPGDALPSVAVVGARMASGYGREAAAMFGRELAENGVQIISGMARGIDGISQRSALAAGGKSYAVLGCGADVIYPEENRDLYEKLIGNGGVISEYPPGTPAAAQLFPSRNRIISALSDLVLIVEAKERSGSLITADYALEQGRDIYAVPGRITDRLAAGCNRLIRQGAGIASCPSDVLEAVAGVRSTEEDIAREPDYFKKMSLQEPEASFYAATGEKDLCDAAFLIRFAEQRLRRTVEAREVMRCMTELVLKGLVEEAGVGIYRRMFR